MTSNKLHVSLDVANVERSTKFYEALFGVPPHKVREGYANFDVQDPPLKLALNEATPTGRGSLNHLGILVPTTQHVEEAQARLSAQGLAIEVERETVCCHATQDKVWVRDPDGNAWEVYAILDDAPERKEEAACCAPTCCKG